MHNLQLVQHLAKIFNNRYGHTFPIPKAVIEGKITVFNHTCYKYISPILYFEIKTNLKVYYIINLFFKPAFLR